jgi:hypothetical protein
MRSERDRRQSRILQFEPMAGSVSDSRIQTSKTTQALLTVANELALPALSPKFFVRLPVKTFGVLAVALVAGQPTSVRAEQSYPWCAQGDNTLHCYYVTREQCEQAVDYHGFCVANSNVPTPNDEAPQQRVRRRRGI